MVSINVVITCSVVSMVFDDTIGGLFIEIVYDLEYLLSVLFIDSIILMFIVLQRAKKQHQMLSRKSPLYAPKETRNTASLVGPTWATYLRPTTSQPSVNMRS